MGPHEDYLGGDDFAIRLDLVNRIRILCHDEDGVVSKQDLETLNQSHLWAQLFILEIDILERLAKDLQDEEKKQSLLFHIPTYLEKIEHLVWFFTKGPKEDWPKEESNIERGIGAVEAVLARDGSRCVLTGKDYPEVCHIWPFWAINKKTIVHGALRTLTAVYGIPYTRDLIQCLTSPDSNKVDSPENMITLCAQLQKYWEAGLFALEPYGQIEKPVKPKVADGEQSTTTARDTPAQSLPPRASASVTEMKKGKQAPEMVYGIKVRFHWLKRTTLASLYDVPAPGANPRNMWKAWDPEVAVYDVNGLPLADGQVIEIWGTDKAAPPSERILKFQWDILRMHALSGGADPAIYAPEWDFGEGGSISDIPRPEKELHIEALESKRTMH
nr:uncharacterized protein CTRU02_10385 [Colletotrichum truncatum]KAF6787122.1 hypothetical protein CTRU02_10385 [Colletotrichum truncatum]